jgi:hypothetical protein
LPERTKKVKKIIPLLISAALLIACAKTATVTPPTNPSPNAGLIDAAEAVQVACEVAAPLAGAFGTLISQACPPFVTGLVSIIESNGTVAALNALVATLQAEVAAVPGASADKAVGDVLAAATGIILIYETATGQVPTPSAASRVSASSGRKTVVLTKAEKDRLKSIRARAEKLKK